MKKWDLYDNKLNKTGEVIDEFDEFPENRYHLSTNAWILNSKNEVLLVRKTLNYNLHYPGFWNNINENVLSGEESKDAVIRSIKERIGIKIVSSEINFIDIQLRDPYKYIYQTCIIRKDIKIQELKFNDGKCVQAKWVDLKELYNMIENGEIAWVLIPRIEKYVIPLMSSN